MNINEIAKMAGVSNATVSRYLNGGSISEKTSAKIRRVIEETGYKPSASARMMRTGQSSYIGVVVPKINSESVSRMVAGLTEVFDKNGYEVLLGNADQSMERELRFLDLFKNREMAGLIFFGTTVTREHIEVLKTFKIPVVILGQSVQGFSSVCFDDYHAAYELTECLLSKPVKRFAYIGVTDKDLAVGMARRKGMLDALEMRHYPMERLISEEAEFSLSSGYNCMKRIYSRFQDVDAVFCSTDSIAVGAMMYLREHGISVPDQVRITGIGHDQKSDIIEPQLTTADYYYRSSGREAASILIDLIRNQKDGIMNRELKLGYELMLRGSTGD
ncbi:MAG: LacI family DNA-binding transcriptional regulator [Lachnospiraceae bacterium]|nr:LacI family DNA-binding transcriptional regulator [Lachnospiraceae bacterium]